MTKREIIYSVIEKLKVYTDDADITEEFIASLIDTKRAMLLKQQFAKNAWHMPIEIKQELCIDLEVANKIDGVSCFGKMLRTKSALPASIKIKGKEGPLNVRKLDRTEIPINIIPVERMPYVGYNSFIAGMIYCAVDYDGRLYFQSNKKNHLFLESIKVTDVYEAPDVAYALECNNDAGSVEAWDSEYPVEAAMADVIVNMIVQELARTLALPQDDENDAEDVSRDLPRGRR